MIRWVSTIAGKPMPIDVGRDPLGSVILVKVPRATGPAEWRVRVLRADEQPDPAIPRYTPHWATCPDAPAWKAARTAADPTGLLRNDRAPEGITTGPCVGCGEPHHRYGKGGTTHHPRCSGTRRVD